MLGDCVDGSDRIAETGGKLGRRGQIWTATSERVGVLRLNHTLKKIVGIRA